MLRASEAKEQITMVAAPLLACVFCTLLTLLTLLVVETTTLETRPRGARVCFLACYTVPASPSVRAFL